MRSLLDEDVECDFAGLTDYNMGLHVGAVFILLGVSLLGAFAPVTLRFIRSITFRTILKIGTYFAFGTVLATGFIHMLQPANEALTSPCLPASWNNSYEAYAFLFAILSILGMHAIDYGLQAWQCQMGSVDDPNLGCSAADERLETGHGVEEGLSLGMHGGAAAHGAQALTTPLRKASDDFDSDASDERQRVVRATSVYIMEAGIVFHSVVIGITLGVSTGSEFNSLIIVLALHQFFEGFAIGFTAVDAALSGTKLLAVGLIYALTTPIGVAVGIGIRHTYNANDSTTLLVQGVFDSISAGILIYVALVQLITPQFTHNKWLARQGPWIKLASFASLYGGVTTMAVIGKWA